LITGSDKYHCFYQYNIKNHINCWKLWPHNGEDNQQPSPFKGRFND
jgi:sucrose-6-phosphate hydrolase SacC (GH32 family)